MVRNGDVVGQMGFTAGGSKGVYAFSDGCCGRGMACPLERHVS